MAKSQVLIELQLIQKGGKISVVAKDLKNVDTQTKNVDRSTKKLNKTQQEQYTRQKQGVIQTANSTKNFSKMQQSVDGGGGAGGLVRAYALLAANVFALTAAFGVLSRSAQIDTLIESMEVLSTTGGTYIRNLAKEMQEASGFAIDLAQGFRQVSLAASAGLNTSEIEGLTTVAKGAAISLGRNLPDAMDRIFRGAIKLEPEILDEIGLFVRVDEAAQKYARQSGKVASALTQVEKRQAFLNEILEQGTRKFQEYADEIKPDAYARLAAALADIAQDGLSLVNSLLGPLLNFLAESKVALSAVFGGLVFFLLKKAIPAMGLMTRTAAEAAQESAQQAKAYNEGVAERTKNAVKAERKILNEKLRSLKKEEEGRKRFKSRAKDAMDPSVLDDKSIKGAKRKELINKRILELEKAQNRAKGKNKALIDSELNALKQELSLEKQILATKRKGATELASGSLAQMRQDKLDSKARVAGVVGDAAGVMETQGIGAGWKQLNEELKNGRRNADGVLESFSNGEKASARFKGGISALGVGFNKLMMAMGPIMVALAVLSPLITWAGKKMGFGREEAKLWSEELKKAQDRTEKLSERVRAQAEVFNDLTASYVEQTKAQLAFNKTMIETFDTTKKLEKAFRKQLETGTGWTEFVDNWIFGMISVSNSTDFEGRTFFSGAEWDFYTQLFENYATQVEQAAIGNNEFIESQMRMIPGADAYMNLLQKEVEIEARKKKALEETTKAMEEGTVSYGSAAEAIKLAKKINDLDEEDFAWQGFYESKLNDLDPAVKKLAIAELELLRTQEKSGEARRNLSKDTADYQRSLEATEGVIREQERILANLDSALEGASESIGKFQSKFLPKTDVDDVLSSFKQMEQGFNDILADEKIDDKKVDEFFNKFADPDNPFNALFAGLFTFDKEGKRVLKDSEEARNQFFKTIEEFEEYQSVILEAKMELKSLTNEQQRFSKLTQTGFVAISKAQTATTNIAKKNLEITSETVDVQLKSFGLSREDNKEMREKLALAGSQLEREKIFLEYSQDANKIRAANSALLEEDEKILEYKIQLATEDLRIQREYGKELLKIFQIYKQLSTETIKLNKATAQFQQLQATGTMKLDPRKTSKLEIEAAQKRMELTITEVQMKSSIQQIEFLLLEKRLDVLYLEDKLTSDQYTKAIKHVRSAAKVSKDLTDTQILNARIAAFTGISTAISNAFKIGTREGIIAGQQAAASKLKEFDEKRVMATAILTQQIIEDMESKLGRKTTREEKGAALDAATEEIDKSRETEAATFGLQMFRETAENMASTLASLGPEGEVVAAVVRGSIIMADSFYSMGQVFKETDNAMERGAAVAATVATSLMQVGQIMAANSKAQMAEIDGQIEAEKRRDGKSAESLAKIKNLEKKKELMAKKAFEQNKKLQMATTVANTAASIMQVWANPADITKGWAIAMTAMIAALGAAQLAIISKTKYQGSGGGESAPTPSQLSIGKASNKIDVSRGAQAGEIGYLRGQRGAPGGAVGMKSYSTGGEGILVGENGPEVVKPTQTVDVIPNDMLGQATNVNFTINAVDATGVEQLLVEQRGNIIEMIRSAANNTGERFLEDVDTQAMGSTGGGYGG